MSIEKELKGRCKNKIKVIFFVHFCQTQPPNHPPTQINILFCCQGNLLKEEQIKQWAGRPILEGKQAKR